MTFLNHNLKKFPSDSRYWELLQNFMHKLFLDTVLEKEVIEAEHWLIECGYKNGVKIERLHPMFLKIKRKDKHFQITVTRMNMITTA